MTSSGVTMRGCAWMATALAGPTAGCARAQDASVTHNTAMHPFLACTLSA
jgi:hypothetical protein